MESLFCSTFMNKRLFCFMTNTHTSFFICGQIDLIKYWHISCCYVPLPMLAILFLVHMAHLNLCHGMVYIIFSLFFFHKIQFLRCSVYSLIMQSWQVKRQMHYSFWKPIYERHKRPLGLKKMDSFLKVWIKLFSNIQQFCDVYSFINTSNSNNAK